MMRLRIMCFGEFRYLMAISRMISLIALCLGMKLSGLSANVAIFDAYVRLGWLIRK